ncbi:hypothetical protein CEXT_589131 [Caerostris extrusa]|uniref:Uncharacterized protein n=1 Tax=Caerostris extrusa TaxID=172846 RepID=A0AAV4Q2J8_CAEEX|nr:hypothetical protein CEXT_589131 [Caerostris extrusa]
MYVLSPSMYYPLRSTVATVISLQSINTAMKGRAHRLIIDCECRERRVKKPKMFYFIKSFPKLPLYRGIPRRKVWEANGNMLMSYFIQEDRLVDEGPAIDRHPFSSSRPDNPVTDISGGFYQCQEVGIKRPGFEMEDRLVDEGPAIDRFQFSSSRPDNPVTDISGSFHQYQGVRIKRPRFEKEDRLVDVGPAIDRFPISSSRPDNLVTNISGGFHQCQEVGNEEARI